MSWRSRMFLASVDDYLTDAFVNWIKQFVFLRQLERSCMLNRSSDIVLWLGINFLFYCIFYHFNLYLYQMHFDLLIDLMINTTSLVILKVIVKRRPPRPRRRFGDKYCFPSVCAARVAFITYFFTYLWPLPSICVPLLLAWSFSICVSKLLMREHYIGDILAGILLGYLQEARGNYIDTWIYNMDTDELRIVHTCGLCEEICEVDEINNHPCLEGYSNYTIDENTLYFYPVSDNGNKIVRSTCNEQNLPEEPLEQTTTSSASKKTSKSKLNFDDEEILILEVQNRPPLWNYTLQLKDRNVKMKKQLWQEIVLIFNGKYSVEELKSRFKSLHDTYRKIIQSEYHASGSARKDSGKKWPHYESMQFLRDSCLYKNTVSNAETVTDKRERTPNTTILINDEDEDEVQSIQTDSTQQRKKRKNLETDALERVADAICTQSNNFAFPPPPVPDEIESFLLSLGHRLRRMPFQVQLNTMQEMLDITYRALMNENE